MAVHALRPQLSGARLEIRGAINRPPMERTTDTVRLFELARSIGAELGIDIDEGSTGGASDGNFTSALEFPSMVLEQGRRGACHRRVCGYSFAPASGCVNRGNDPADPLTPFSAPAYNDVLFGGLPVTLSPRQNRGPEHLLKTKVHFCFRQVWIIGYEVGRVCRRGLCCRAS